MENFFDEIIDEAIRENASDIYIQSESPAFLRINGRMTKAGIRRPEGYELDHAIECILKIPGARSQLYDREEKDLSYTKHTGKGREKKAFRFRINICLSKKGVAIVMRRLKSVEPEPAKLGIPDKLVRLITDTSAGGIVFIAGPTGSGKSTTLASIIAFLLQSRALNCVTIEDPIEYDIPDGKGNIIEREVGTTTLSFEKALRAAMRQRPDIILVGEVRDPETSLAAIQAAKTGHLVFTTIHTLMATQVPSRIVSMFPIEKHSWVIQELSDVLLAIMVQVLVPGGRSGPKPGELLLATEYLDVQQVSTRELILAGQYDRLRDAQRCSGIGWTLNQSLKSLVISGTVDESEARRVSNDLTRFMDE
jgi:twitching motility protein PilT